LSAFIKPVGKEYLHTLVPEVVVDEKGDILKMASQWLIE
jgi:hypothetical protein